MPRVYNKRHGDAPIDAVYGGRPGPFGNPFKIGTHGNREQVIELHRIWLLCNPQLIELVKKQRGKNWVCWCYPLACHCDIYLEVANA
jgi:hypothetical protein